MLFKRVQTDDGIGQVVEVRDKGWIGVRLESGRADVKLTRPSRVTIIAEGTSPPPPRASPSLPRPPSSAPPGSSSSHEKGHARGQAEVDPQCSYRYILAQPLEAAYMTTRADETPREAAEKLEIDLELFVGMNRIIWPNLTETSRLKKGTQLMKPLLNKTAKMTQNGWLFTGDPRIGRHGRRILSAEKVCDGVVVAVWPPSEPDDPLMCMFQIDVEKSTAMSPSDDMYDFLYESELNTASKALEQDRRTPVDGVYDEPSGQGNDGEEDGGEVEAEVAMEAEGAEEGRGGEGAAEGPSSARTSPPDQARYQNGSHRSDSFLFKRVQTALGIGQVVEVRDKGWIGVRLESDGNIKNCRPSRVTVIAEDAEDEASAADGATSAEAEAEAEAGGEAGETEMRRGKWTEREHELFVEAVALYGRSWTQVAKHIGTRIVPQVRAHASTTGDTLDARAQTAAIVDAVAGVKLVNAAAPTNGREPVHPADDVGGFVVVDDLDFGYGALGEGEGEDEGQGEGEAATGEARRDRFGSPHSEATTEQSRDLSMTSADTSGPNSDAEADAEANHKADDDAGVAASDATLPATKRRCLAGRHHARGGFDVGG